MLVIMMFAGGGGGGGRHMTFSNRIEFFKCISTIIFKNINNVVGGGYNETLK